MPPRVLVTAALPYANGSAHMGHLVEYIQADIYVRALRALGEDALYICANDAHGTPIEVNAKRLGVTPEALVAKVHAEHRRDFARFDIAFDHFGITHCDRNRTIVTDAYHLLRERGHLEDRTVDGNWCARDQRFLPDRFVRGECPRCGAADQYGDVCERCRSTYRPTELKDPRCVLCGEPPVVRQSEHVFFRLAAADSVAFLQQWIRSGVLQSDVANYVGDWIDKGLMDWCISRDGPYFGFEIPDRPEKFFYVWLDAPFGYAASAAEWGERHGVSLAALWHSKETRIEHIIGKDIVYFHTLFWPAVLWRTGYSLPSRVHVHGMLTIDGEKMSKSRGTFINASTFAAHIEPQTLRFYYASKYSAGTDDIDLSFDDFVTRTNAELVNKHANLVSRACQFVCGKLDGRLGPLPTEARLAGEVTALVAQVEVAYRALEFGRVVRLAGSIADVGNEYFQRERPWDLVKADVESARAVCTFAANVCHALAVVLCPIVPRFSAQVGEILRCDVQKLDHTRLFQLHDCAIGPMQRLVDRILQTQVAAVLDSSRPAP
jgi:methionyl-tRNA synthetase